MKNSLCSWTFILLATFFLSVSVKARADQNYSQQVFFENSLSPGNYFYSSGKISAPSTLTLVHGKLPVETVQFISGPNALELQWQSKTNGGWDAEIKLYNWRNRNIEFPGDNLYLWLYTKDGIRAADLPRIALRDVAQGFTRQLSMGSFTKDLAPGKWTRVKIPLNRFATASLHPFDPHRLISIILTQGATDGVAHTLDIDDIRIENEGKSRHIPAAPETVEAKGYERHIDIKWKAPEDPGVAQYVIYRSMHGGTFEPIGVQRYGVNRFCDFLGDPHATASYRVSARTSSLKESPMSPPATASTHPMTDDELLTMVQEASFRYYWEANEPNSGMARENTPGNDDIIAVGASGFGIMSLVVGANRNFAPRDQIVDRLLRITDFLARADRFHGAWPHFLSGKTGHVLPVFGIYDDGADLVETSFLMQGLLTARQYFNRDDEKERRLRDNITKLWQGVDWNWFRATPERDALYWHWSPDYAFHIANRLKGWNEVMITYLLAIASPTHPVPASLYATGYTAQGPGKHVYGERHTYDGIQLDMNYTPTSPGPLFFTQYSYQGYDPRGWHDQYADYFVNNRNEALVSQAYSIANPLHMKGYGADCWGLTAVDGPRGYREYKPFSTDDGTIAPTGAITSYAYTPKQSLLALKHFYRDLGAQVWGIYGFRDAFNQEQNWYSGITMGLNQAPMAVMIENGRTGLIWRCFMSNPEMAHLRQKIGLEPDSK